MRTLSRLSELIAHPSVRRPQADEEHGRGGFGRLVRDYGILVRGKIYPHRGRRTVVEAARRRLAQRASQAEVTRSDS